MTTIFFLVYLAHLFLSIGACPLGCECDVSLVVTCTKLNLTDVPDDIPTDTKELYLDVNFITILKNDSFSNLHGLTLLAIRFNQIHTIESGAFNNLTKLSHLYLDNNYISQLSEDVFFPLLVINTVSLEYNNISTLWKFSSVSPLATLNLRYNKISFIESCTFVGLTNLKVLQLDRNNVSTIEDRALEGLAHLQNLYLQHNALISLPDSLFSCCTVIQLLDFSHNKIEELPDLTFLWNLTLLDSSHNDILYIDENAFTAQSRLQTLELQNNLLNSVPVLHSVVSLTTLDLERNRISYVPDDAFHNKSNFRDLRLGYNLMKRIPEAVKGLTLQTLRLNGNPIVRVEANAFEGLNNLHRLQLDRMALIHLDENAFLDLKQNQEPLSLFLNDNQLQSLPGEIFSDLNIDIINLEDNLWSCDCAMCEYSHWLSNHNEIEKFDVTCVQPDQYLDIMLSEIHDTDDLICELPVIVESSNYIEAVEGDSVMFPCNATGLPLPFIYWQTPHGHKISLETDMDDIMLLSNGTLILHNAAFSDCGIYSCVAINEAGEDVFNTTLLVVFDTINTTQQQTVPVTSQGTSNAVSQHTLAWQMTSSNTRPRTQCNVPTQPPVTTDKMTTVLPTTSIKKSTLVSKFVTKATSTPVTTTSEVTTSKKSTNMLTSVTQTSQRITSIFSSTESPTGSDVNSSANIGLILGICAALLVITVIAWIFIIFMCKRYDINPLKRKTSKESENRPQTVYDQPPGVNNSTVHHNSAFSQNELMLDDVRLDGLNSGGFAFDNNISRDRDISPVDQRTLAYLDSRETGRLKVTTRKGSPEDEGIYV